MNFELHHDDASPCIFCNTQVPLEIDRCGACEAPLSRINILELLNMFLKGKIVDVRHGGLLIGRDSPVDDIPLYSETAVGVYHKTSLVQGQEYILSELAYFKHFKRVEEINEYKDPRYLPIKELGICTNLRVFNTNSADGILSVLAGKDQFIVNRAATRTHYEELEKLNNLA